MTRSSQTRAGRTPRVLAIAGSDSGGGAGIQADLKAIASCGVHGMTAITAITAQSTVGVDAVHEVPPDVIVAQAQAVVADIGVDAVKVGMLGAAATVQAVARVLESLPRHVPVVVDPVMVAESGAPLLAPDALTALVELILPRATVITPNVPEARALASCADIELPAGAGRAPAGEGAEARALARALRTLGPRVVIVTGGHRRRTVDTLCDRDGCIEIGGVRHPGGASHGSGCTHSSVLAARLALGDDPRGAARAARRAAGRAVARGLRDVGRGAGPVDVLGLESIRTRASNRGSLREAHAPARRLS